MESIFRWLAGFLAGILERYADPDLQARLDGFNARVAAAELKEKEAVELERQSAEAYTASANRRAAWDKLLVESKQKEVESEQRLRESQDRVKAIENEAAEAKKKLDDLTGGDRVRVDL